MKVSDAQLQHSDRKQYYWIAKKGIDIWSSNTNILSASSTLLCLSLRISYYEKKLIFFRLYYISRFLRILNILAEIKSPFLLLTIISESSQSISTDTLLLSYNMVSKIDLVFFAKDWHSTKYIMSWALTWLTVSLNFIRNNQRKIIIETKKQIKLIDEIDGEILIKRINVWPRIEEWVKQLI